MSKCLFSLYNLKKNSFEKKSKLYSENFVIFGIINLKTCKNPFGRI